MADANRNELAVIVGAGSTVIRDLPDGVLASGVPARIVEGYRTTP